MKFLSNGNVVSEILLLHMSVDDCSLWCRLSWLANIRFFQCLLFSFQLLVLSKNTPDGLRIQFLRFCSDSCSDRSLVLSLRSLFLRSLIGGGGVVFHFHWGTRRCDIVHLSFSFGHFFVNHLICCWEWHIVLRSVLSHLCLFCNFFLGSLLALSLFSSSVCSFLLGSCLGG